MTRDNYRLADFDAVIFDMDGVVTDTAEAHAAAWKRLFDEFLRKRSEREDVPFQAFDARSDYRQYVDGKPRFDGVRSFLATRGIDLPQGTPDGDAGEDTVVGLGNCKDRYFNEWLQTHPARVFPSTINLIRKLRAAGVSVGIFSASRNCEAVLSSAGVLDLFDARVDGVEAGELGLRGKPAPDTLVRLARKLRAEQKRVIVVEDAIAGVRAGKAGGFGLVIGLNRNDYGAELAINGADLVLSDLGELSIGEDGQLAPSTIRQLPKVEQRRREIAAKLAGRDVAVFLDYDGTLTDIVADRNHALLSDDMRAALASLAEKVPLAIISGRDLADIRRLVSLPGVFLAGSHGFEFEGPGIGHVVQPDAEAYLEDLDRAERELHAQLAGIPGHDIERKRFTIAVHYRQVPDDSVETVKRTVDTVLRESPNLRKGFGKKVLEIRPNLSWGKGDVLRELLDRLEFAADGEAAIYIGDDVTDEDAFRTLGENSIGIVVGTGDRATAASYSLPDPAAVQEFLAWIAQLREHDA